jgi:hypothetical protein
MSTAHQLAFLSIKAYASTVALSAIEDIHTHADARGRNRGYQKQVSKAQRQRDDSCNSRLHPTAIILVCTLMKH